MDLAKQAKDKKEQIQTFMTLGEVCFLANENIPALRYYQQCLEMSRNIKSAKLSSEILNNIAKNLCVTE